jgi:hypothetical protein
MFSARIESEGMFSASFRRPAHQGRDSDFSGPKGTLFYLWKIIIMKRVGKCSGIENADA